MALNRRLFDVQRLSDNMRAFAAVGGYRVTVYRATAAHRKTPFYVVTLCGSVEKYRRKSDAIERYDALVAMWRAGDNNRVWS